MKLSTISKMEIVRTVGIDAELSHESSYGDQSWQDLSIWIFNRVVVMNRHIFCEFVRAVPINSCWLILIANESIIGEIWVQWLGEYPPRRKIKGGHRHESTRGVTWADMLCHQPRDWDVWYHTCALSGETMPKNRCGIYNIPRDTWHMAHVR